MVRFGNFLSGIVVIAIVAAVCSGLAIAVRVIVREEVERGLARLPAPVVNVTPAVCPAAQVVVTPTSLPPPMLPVPPPPMPSSASCRGMTWVSIGQQGPYVHVGADNNPSGTGTNAYRGDTACSERLPVLCIKKENLPQPTMLTIDFYNGWTGAEVKFSAPVEGGQLVSRAAADEVCERQFGSGWRMGEHHDGNGGWHFWGVGQLPTNGGRMWAAINDQPANPWNSR